MADNAPFTPGSGRNAATDEVTHSGQTADVQLVRPAYVTGAEGSKTVIDQAVGAGVVSTGTQRMTLATDDAAIALLLARVGEVQASPTANTVLDRLKALLTGPVPVSDNGGVLTVDGTVELGAAALAALETITVASVTAPLAAGTNNIGDVDVVTQVGAANLANAQVSVDTTSGGVTVAAARATRRSVTVVNHGTTAVYLGTGTVSTANGVLLPGTAGAAFTFYTTAAIKGIVGAGTQTVGVSEEYD